ncbi:multidrug ABC transporter ATP-binding protein [Candidatus Bathyarchaeota archaeon]|nr:MAG: multidrug ABC transporter ATP-binding protein [Candidatus Bathyarchaeota archaeon]
MSDRHREGRRGGFRRRGPMSHMGGRTIEKAKDTRGALRRLLSYLKPFRLQLGVVVFLAVTSTLLSLLGPYLIGVVIDQFISTGDLQGLLSTSLLMLGTYLGRALTSMASGWIMVTVAQRVLKNLRKELFEHLQTLSLSFFDRQPTGDLMSRLTNDVDAVNQALTQNVTRLITSLLTSVGVLLIMFGLNIWLALGSLLVFPIMIGVAAIVGKRTRSGFRGLQMNMGRLNATMEETISGERVVIAFDQQRTALKKFDLINHAVRDAGIHAMTYAFLVMPLMGILSNLNIAVVAGLGGWLILNGMASVGTIASFISYSRLFAQPLRQIAELYNSIQSALAGSERIFEIIDERPEVQDAPDAFSLENVKGQVVFDHVNFNYVPEIPVLKDISFVAEPGQTIALVGPTGAGKTTIINVLTRFYDIQSGAITIDGHDVRQIQKDTLRRQLGIVLQDVFLFSGTVMDNIRYGRLDATKEECIEAAKLANADNFITRLPQGYLTPISERGGNLSQGQRQLLSIARAIVADPGILILDEATSSIDTRTEVQIQEALLRLMKDRTSFVIAHRLSTIRNADQVLVINHGEIIERGTHEELLTTKGFYYRLYMSQFKGTNGDEDFKRITLDEPVPMRQQQGWMGGLTGVQTAFSERIRAITDVFLNNGAVSPETAKTPEELGLPPQFRAIQGRMDKKGLFLEHDGRYYLSEERLKQMQKQSRK